MDTLEWRNHKQSFLGTMLDVSVARSSETNLIVEEWKKARLKPPSEELTIMRHPPSIVGEPIGFSPKGKPIFRPTSLPAELWKVNGLGSFDSIRFARAVFSAPAEEFFRHGVGSLEAMVDDLSQICSEGEFQLVYADSAMLEFSLTKPGSQVEKKQRQLLDELNQEFFIGGAPDKHMKSVDLSLPDSFVLGAP